MADSTNKSVRIPFLRMLDVIRLKKREISAIYFFAVVHGLLQLSIPLGIQAVINFLQAYTFSTSLWVLIILVLVGVLLSGALQVSQLKLIERINQKLFARYGFEFAFRIPRWNIKKVDDYYLPEQVNRFFDTVSIQKGLGKLLLDIPTASIQILFGLILLSFYSSVFIVFGIVLLIILILIISLTSNKGLSTSLTESDYKYNLAGWLEEMGRAFKTFKINNLNNLHLKKSDAIVDNYLVARTKHFNVLLLQYWALIIFKVLITAAMLVVGAVLTINNRINLGQFVASEIVIIMIMASVEKFIFSLDNVYDVLTSIEKIGKVLDKPLDTYGTLAMPDADRGVAVKLENVSFSFDDNVEVLSNISFEVPAGSKVCIMGGEGAGKSILLRLLTGSYSDFKGSIQIDQIPVSNYNQASFQEHMGVIVSDQDIFKGTLLENITLDRQNFSFEHLSSLATMVELEDYKEKLPLGYDTVIDAAGRRLSRSTIQKILLIRALLHTPRLLLLENAWSSLSKPLASKLETHILRNMPNTTAFIVSNDASFAGKCQYVIVLKQGRLEKFGTAAQVLDF